MFQSLKFLSHQYDKKHAFLVFFCHAMAHMSKIGNFRVNSNFEWLVGFGKNDLDCAIFYLKYHSLVKKSRKKSIFAQF